MLTRAAPPKSRVILASTGRLLATSSTPVVALDELKVEVADYLLGKFYSAPRDLLSLESYETDDGSFAVETLETALGQIWAVRFSEPDTTAPARSWTVEITLGRDAANVMLGCRLSCFSRNQDFDVDARAPRLLSQFVHKHRFSTNYGFAFSSSPVPMETDDDVQSLLRLIRHQERWANVVVFSLDDGGYAAVNPEPIASQVAGLGHVFTLSASAAETLAREVGRGLSVFNKGVRIYRPAFSDEDDLSRHPLVVRKRLEGITQNQQRQFERWIRELCFASSIERSDLSQGVPAFAAIRSAATLVRVNSLKSRGASIEDQLVAQEAARLAAEAQASDSLALAVQEEELRRGAEQERDQYRGQAMSLVARVEALEAQLSGLGASKELGERPISYDAVAEWVTINFAGKLVLAPRAIRGLKAAEYESLDAVCTGLALLATKYREVLLGRTAKEEFDAELSNQGFSLSGSISESRAGEHGDEYFVSYGGSRRFLHGHLQRGNSYEPRYCLRIYFFWHEEESQLVVGWLPSHLTNRFS